MDNSDKTVICLIWQETLTRYNDRKGAILDYLIYQYPGACSRVVLIALEEAGLSYQDKGLALMSGEHMQPEFVTINPKSKVPVLVSDGVAITELPVILMYLAQQHPDASLLPIASEGSVSLESLSDLIWLAGAVHPLASRLFRPTALSELDAEGIKAGAIKQLAVHAAKITTRLEKTRWLYGEDWSISDTLLAWIFSVAGRLGFPISDYPLLRDHIQRIEARPSFERALQRERNSVKRDGLQLPPGMTLQ